MVQQQAAPYLSEGRLNQLLATVETRHLVGIRQNLQHLDPAKLQPLGQEELPDAAVACAKRAGRMGRHVASGFV